jgi:hypothetical protein
LRNASIAGPSKPRAMLRVCPMQALHPNPKV